MCKNKLPSNELVKVYTEKGNNIPLTSISIL